jgi:hypothetical protein
MKKGLSILVICFLVSMISAADTTFVVKWELTTLISNTYPNTDKANEYGIVSQSSCCDLCCHNVEREMEREFKTKIEVDDFIKNMPLQNYIFNIGCRDPKIYKIIKELIE